MQTWWTLSLDALFQGTMSLAGVFAAFAAAGYQIRAALEGNKKTARFERDMELRDLLIPLMDLARLAQAEISGVAEALRPSRLPAEDDSRPAPPNVFAQFDKYDELLMSHWRDVRRTEKEELQKRFLTLRANLGFLRHGLIGDDLNQQVAKLDEVSGMAKSFGEEFERALPRD